MPPDDLAQALRHEERLREVEDRMSAHEAVCGERYNRIMQGHNNVEKSIESVNTALRENVRYMLWALIVLALTNVLGKDVVGAIMHKWLGL